MDSGNTGRSSVDTAGRTRKLAAGNSNSNKPVKDKQTPFSSSSGYDVI
jgi:hypothetical protein